jgi:hypothetical protein
VSFAQLSSSFYFYGLIYTAKVGGGGDRTLAAIYTLRKDVYRQSCKILNGGSRALMAAAALAERAIV